jgi:cation:H+ antiporter
MPPALAIPLFLASLAVTLAAAAYFADRLDHIGPRLGMHEALVGLLTAFAADGPELSSAIFALAVGSKAASLGVVVGSNAFNLAAMVGLSAVLTGAVRIPRGALKVEAAMGLFATLVAGALILGVLPAWVALAAIAVAAVPYLRFLVRGTSDDPNPAKPRRGPLDERAMWKLAVPALGSVALIVLGAAGMVHSGLALADTVNMSEALVGVLILAILTSLPNAFTAVRLGLDDRGTALVSETFNSNSINLIGGVMLPALIVGLAAPTGIVKFALAWLLLMTLVTTGLLWRRGAGTRGEGVLLIALYLIFVAVQLARG